jgi:hypothetical protein
MLPEFARRFEKARPDGVSRRSATQAHILDEIRGIFRFERAGPPSDVSVLARAPEAVRWLMGGCAAEDAWWGSETRAALVIGSDLWRELGRSAPAPSPVNAPTSSGVVYVEGAGLGVFWATIGHGAAVPSEHEGRPVCVCRPLDHPDPMGWMREIAASGGMDSAGVCCMLPQHGPAPVDPAWDASVIALWNLFALMADRAITEQPVNGGHARVVRSGEKVKAAHRSYTRLSLTEPIRRRTDEDGEPTGRHVVAHIRRGHWRRYWVRDPEGRVTLAKKPGKHGDLHEVRQWVRPCKVGDGEPRRREYVVGL